VSGDEDARQRLFARHYEGISRFFELNATWVAEDLTQRTFVACLERLATVPPEAFRAYLFGIARNQLRMFRRRLATRAAHDTPEPEVRRTGVSTIVARSQEQRKLLVALGKLPEDQRIVVTLHYWEELNSSELGRVLELPASTARTRLARARDALRESMLAQGSRAEDLEASLRALVPSLAKA
jgi:RNA polymerase sigma-70 factor (ECF subfamily)